MNDCREFFAQEEVDRMRALITGFPPFPGRPENPSEAVVRLLQREPPQWPGLVLQTALLPVEYAGVENAVDDLLRDVQPDIWLALGVGRQSTPVRLETQAVNCDASDRPDNSGNRRCGEAIEPGGPSVRRIPWSCDSLLAELQAAQIPAECGDDAGTYVCNHLLYYVLQRLEQLNFPCRFLFVHLAPPECGLPPENLSCALQIILNWLQNQHAGQSRSETTLASF